MIEIIVIWRLAVGIGRRATAKGLKKVPYQIMAILLWFFGEFTGLMLSTIFTGSNSSTLLDYGLALVGAVFGAGLAFLIMRLIPGPVAVAVSPMAIGSQDVSVTQMFGRTVWLPVVVILVAISCACMALFSVAFYQA